MKRFRNVARSPVIVDALVERIVELRASGLTIVLAEHSLDFCLATADQVTVIEKGAVRHTVSSAAFDADKALQASLLAI